jgi:alkylation response protein AidB-like acyl-CoA dehydrogenase
MYSFDPSEEQTMLIDVARRYAESELRPAARDAEEAGRLPEGLVDQGWELGILQASIPEEYGGFGERSALTGVLATEELGRGDLAGALAVMAPASFAVPILLAGTEDQKKRWLPPLVEGAWRPWTAAWIEGSHDFDPGDVRTEAVRDGSDFVLSGTKRFAPFADGAEGMIVHARLDGRTQGFVVPKDAEGVTVGEREKTLGLQALPCHPVRFEGVRVPGDHRLGGADGHDPALLVDASRLAMAALAIGVAGAALEYAVGYAKERVAFGVKIGQKQSIAFMIAEMAAEIEAARLLAWEAAWKSDRGDADASRAVYLAHGGASDAAMTVTDRAVQILGGYGYTREYPVELWYRNGRGIAALTGLAML